MAFVMAVPYAVADLDNCTWLPPVRFRKSKKKVRKVRKRGILKPDDLLPLPEQTLTSHSGSTSVDQESVLEAEDDSKKGEDVEIDEAEYSEIVGPEEDLTGVFVEEDHAESELQSALNKARKLKQKESLNTGIEKVAEVALKKEPKQEESAEKIGSIVLNSTAEFCRTLETFPLMGCRKSKDEADEIMDFERELMEEQQLKELEAQNRGAWNEVDIDDKPVEINVTGGEKPDEAWDNMMMVFALNQESIPILEEEPDVSTGMAAALQLAMKKGYLENEVKKPVSAQRHSDLQAQSYTIEEKF
ncbi:U4/U6.U5 tri-snRNP-associated protein 1-like [Tachypleus tridentatus]|uniref:U4/U6.U5 tri-snRNP-associated protein 1-like n=1 Tax=Tachypleus tridentatus TaxID=6853 RepID=UPI003FD29BB9